LPKISFKAVVVLPRYGSQFSSPKIRRHSRFKVENIPKTQNEPEDDALAASKIQLSNFELDSILSSAISEKYVIPIVATNARWYSPAGIQMVASLP
jgi:hypothetical protein